LFFRHAEFSKVEQRAGEFYYKGASLTDELPRITKDATQVVANLVMREFRADHEGRPVLRILADVANLVKAGKMGNDIIRFVAGQ